MLTTTLLLAALLGQAAAEEPEAPADDFQPDPAWRELGPAIWFDPEQKSLIIRARVALREGFLEHLLCLDQTKEHESILATEAPPRLIHAGLLLTGAEPGHPVQYRPEFKPPAGTPIGIELQWNDADGKPQRVDAKQWIKDQDTGKTLETDWVFAGSDLFRDPDTGEMVYAADGGDLITVANFVSAILDLPFASSAEDTERSYVANTPRIPPQGTRVTMFLRPVMKPSPVPETP